MVKRLHSPMPLCGIRMGPSTGFTDRRSACSLIAAGRSCFKTMSFFASVNTTSSVHLTLLPSGMLISPSAVQCFDGSSMSFADTLMRIGAHSLSSPCAATVYACIAPCPLRGTSRTTAVAGGPLLIISPNPQRCFRAGASARHPAAQHINSSKNTASDTNDVLRRGSHIA
ncbi:surface protease GP63 [Trypanosoma rangeli SC58]|uniref:Surface protease GP63 n=1 Tax=Trypanosoma rangeli SC58 TaxID=429131 RepID=A0A061J7H6_TRYRA|nr:surface protease GP63 [Trypanosoma rangeli SC58]